MEIISGLLVDIFEKRIFPANVHLREGKISKIESIPELTILSKNKEQPAFYILPGFVDAHVHIESSMLVPAEFARMAVVHGTVGTVSDPHEIANVCGIEGVEFMIADGNRVPFKFNFGAPSCVPATVFETAGATLDAQDVSALLQRREIKYLSEMMNFPGVFMGDKEVMDKIAAAKLMGKPVDGHAPGLRGEEARRYIQAGISTDHECFTKEEALDKLQWGMKILIREGSAARNFEALIELLHDHPNDMMFCSDDKHPDSLLEGHINLLCSRAINKGIDVFNVLRAACINPVLHYNLDIGLLREGDAADFIVVQDLKTFKILQTYINGELVAENGRVSVGGRWDRGNEIKKQTAINNFKARRKEIAEFAIPISGAEAGKLIPVIEALEGQLITNSLYYAPKIHQGNVVSDTDRDMLKIVVVNRYYEAPVAKSFIKNFGLKSGAIASSVAHDSHNIVAIGVDDESLCKAVNLVIQHQGGISCVSPSSADEGNVESVLPLPVAGLMSAANGYEVAAAYTAIDAMAKSLGSTLAAPFMTLSFMALLVIPHLKLSDKGLFDGDKFEFV
ncbi:MAG: adenine deaminase [Chitinophagaceae bacterium]